MNPKITRKHDEFLVAFQRTQWQKLDENTRLIRALSTFQEFNNLSEYVTLEFTKVFKVKEKNVVHNSIEIKKELIYTKCGKNLLENFKIVFFFIEIPETFTYKVVGGAKKEVFEEKLSITFNGKVITDQYLFRAPLPIFEKNLIGVENSSKTEHPITLYEIDYEQFKGFLENPQVIDEVLRRNFEIINGRHNILLYSQETNSLVEKHRKDGRLFNEENPCPLCLDLSFSFLYLSFRFSRNANFDKFMKSYMNSLWNVLEVDSFSFLSGGCLNFLKKYIPCDVFKKISLCRVPPGTIPTIENHETLEVIKLPHLDFLDLFGCFPIWGGYFLVESGNGMKTLSFDIQKKWVVELGREYFEYDKDFSSYFLRESSNGLSLFKETTEKLLVKHGFKKESILIFGEGRANSNGNIINKRRIWIPEELPSLETAFKKKFLPPCLQNLISTVKKNGAKFTSRKASRILADLGFKTEEIMQFYEDNCITKSIQIKETSAHLFDEGSVPEIESLKKLNEDPENSSKESFRTLGSRCGKIISSLPVSSDGFYCPFKSSSFLKSEEVSDIEDIHFAVEPLEKCSRYFSHVAGLNYLVEHKSPTIWFLHRLREEQKKKED